MQPHGDNGPPQRQRLIVVAIALVLAGAGLVVWLLADDEPDPSPLGAAGAAAGGRTEAAAPDAEGLTFDAETVGRTPRTPTRTITSHEVRQLQRRYGSQIKYCYQKPSRRAAPLIERKTNIVVHLAPYGRVTRVDVDAGGDRELQGCLRRFIKQWRFPSNLGAQQVRFPIVFAR